jgi:hypothetical protein
MSNNNNTNNVNSNNSLNNNDNTDRVSSKVVDLDKEPMDIDAIRTDDGKVAVNSARNNASSESEAQAIIKTTNTAASLIEKKAEPVPIVIEDKPKRERKAASKPVVEEKGEKEESGTKKSTKSTVVNATVEGKKDGEKAVVNNKSENIVSEKSETSKKRQLESGNLLNAEVKDNRMFVFFCGFFFVFFCIVLFCYLTTKLIF